MYSHAHFWIRTVRSFYQIKSPDLQNRPGNLQTWMSGWRSGDLGSHAEVRPRTPSAKIVSAKRKSSQQVFDTVRCAHPELRELSGNSVLPQFISRFRLGHNWTTFLSLKTKTLGSPGYLLHWVSKQAYGDEPILDPTWIRHARSFMLSCHSNLIVRCRQKLDALDVIMKNTSVLRVPNWQGTNLDDSVQRTDYNITQHVVKYRNSKLTWGCTRTVQAMSPFVQQISADGDFEQDGSASRVGG